MSKIPFGTTPNACSIGGTFYGAVSESSGHAKLTRASVANALIIPTDSPSGVSDKQQMPT